VILVTGCTGYIGSRLTLTLLEAGEAVRGLVLPREVGRAASLIDAGMEIWMGDLFFPETLQGISEGITIIYHMAGLHSSSIQRMTNLYVEGTRHLIQACAEAPVKACVVASNGAVYGDSGEEWLTEQRIPVPSHPFGQITLRMEKVLLEAYQRSCFPVIILRIAEVYGPGKYDLLRNVRQGRVRLLGDGMNWTSLIHIDDLLTILTLAPIHLCAGGIYNVADDLPVCQRDLYNDLAAQIGALQPEWIPLDEATERLKLSIHGLRSLSIRLANDAILTSLGLALCYPTYRDGIVNELSMMNARVELSG
jgi:nucleoside-diphosphate-sugar epimerase